MAFPEDAQPGTIESAYDPSVGAVHISIGGRRGQDEQQVAELDPRKLGTVPLPAIMSDAEPTPTPSSTGQAPFPTLDNPQGTTPQFDRPPTADDLAHGFGESSAEPPARPLSETAQIIARSWLEAGYSPEQVSGILGAVGGGENTGLNPTLRNMSSGAFGIYQHLGDRLAALQQFAGSNLADPLAQTRFAQSELNGPMSPFNTRFRQMTNAADAAREWMLGFEKPGVDYSPQAMALAAQVLPSVKALSKGIKSQAPQVAPYNPSQPFGVKLPPLDNIPPQAPGSARDSRMTSQFVLNHSTDLNPFREFVTHVGIGAAQSALEMAGLPGDAAEVANWLSGGSLFKPYDWRDPTTGGAHFPTSTELLKSQGQILGYDFLHPPETNWAGTLGKNVGQTLVSTLPVLLGQAGLAAAGVGKAGGLLAMARSNPLKFAALEGVLEPAGAGMGLGEAEEALRSWGNNDDPNALAKLALGTALNARLPVLMVLMPMVRGIKNSVISGASKMLGLGKPNPAAWGALTIDQAHTVVSDAINDNLNDALNRAKSQVAMLSRPRVAALASVSPERYTEQAADLFSTAIDGTYTAARLNERALWKAVDPDLGRDYGRSIGLYKQMLADFKTDVADHNRQPTDFPTDFLAKLFAQKQEVPRVLTPARTDEFGNPLPAIMGTGAAYTQGMREIDNLGTGINTRSAVEGEIRRLEADPSIPGRRAQIGTLQKISRSILDDMQSGSQGANPSNFTQALAYSRAFNDWRTSPEMADVLAKKRSGEEQITDVLKLDKFLKTKLLGVSAYRTLTTGEDLANNPGALISLQKDALRQKFVDQVAPSGYIDQTKLRRFTGPDGYGPLLAQPQYKDLLDEIETAGRSENAALSATSLGNSQVERFPSTLSGEDRYAAAVELWAARPAQQVMDNLESAPNQKLAAANVIAAMKQDQRGDAVKGFQRLVADRAAKGGAPNLAQWAEKNEGLVSELAKVDPGFKTRLQELSSVRSKFGTIAHLTNIAARYVVGGVGSKLAMSGAGHSMMLTHSTANLGSMWLKQLTEEQGGSILGLMLANQGAFEAFKKGVGGGDLAALKQLHAWMLGSPAAVALDQTIHQQEPALQQGEKPR